MSGDYRLPNVKAAMLITSNDYFYRVADYDERAGTWLGGLVGAAGGWGATIGAGIGLAALGVALSIGTFGIAPLAIAVGAIMGYFIKKATTSLYKKKAYQLGPSAASSGALAEVLDPIAQASMATSLGSVAEFESRTFYQCTSCYTLFITPLNEDPNNSKYFRSHKDCPCPVCNTFHTLLREARKSATLGMNYSRVCDEMILNFGTKGCKTFKKRSFTEIFSSIRSILSIAGPATIPDNDPILISKLTDALFRYKLVCLMPDAGSYKFGVQSWGHQHNDAGAFIRYSPFATEFLCPYISRTTGKRITYDERTEKVVRDNFDIFELMRRMLFYVSYPIPPQNCIGDTGVTPKWRGSYFPTTGRRFGSSYLDHYRKNTKKWSDDTYKALTTGNDSIYGKKQAALNSGRQKVLQGLKKHLLRKKAALAFSESGQDHAEKRRAQNAAESGRKKVKKGLLAMQAAKAFKKAGQLRASKRELANEAWLAVRTSQVMTYSEFKKKRHFLSTHNDQKAAIGATLETYERIAREQPDRIQKRIDHLNTTMRLIESLFTQLSKEGRMSDTVSEVKVQIERELEKLETFLALKPYFEKDAV